MIVLLLLVVIVVLLIANIVLTLTARQKTEPIQQLKHDILNSQKLLADAHQAPITQALDSQHKQSIVITNQLAKQTETIEKKLKDLQEDNAKKLDQMRQTVDEKLQSTLERRLNESFKLVSERLAQVHKGLGEMQSLATGVGDLKRVLTNVKTRGTWGEIQLGTLLEQVLTPDQYEANVATNPQSQQRVDFAIKLPGKDNDTVWLPIDSKFPQEDFERLLQAQENADKAQVELSQKQLEAHIKLEAKKINGKYINPPHTTDFAILFLPIESLYAEVLRQPGLQAQLQQTYRVIIAGPTTFAALLNSLQMGFRTLAIEKRSSDVWALLSDIQKEFGKFGDILAKTQKKLQEASDTIDKAASKSRNIERKLTKVDTIETPERTEPYAIY